MVGSRVGRDALTGLHYLHLATAFNVAARLIISHTGDNAPLPRQTETAEALALRSATSLPRSRQLVPARRPLPHLTPSTYLGTTLPCGTTTTTLLPAAHDADKTSAPPAKKKKKTLLT